MASKGLLVDQSINRPVILPAALLGPRFVGPSAVLADPEDVGYAALARGITGILLNDHAAGPASVVISGTQQITVDDAYTAGDLLTLGASGKATALAEGLPALVRLLEDTAQDGDIAECEVIGLPFFQGGETVLTFEVTPTAEPHVLVTGLALVTYASATFKTPPSLTHMWAQAHKGDQAGSPAAGSVNLVGQKPTAANDVTPIAATTPWSTLTVTVRGNR